MIRGALLLSGLAFVVFIGAGADRPPIAVPPGASVAELGKARIDVAAEAFRWMKQANNAGVWVNSADKNAWTRRCFEARLDLSENKEQRVAILAEWVGAVKEQESLDQKSVAAAANPPSAQRLDLAATTYLRLEVEIRLAKERGAQ
jgi:hypothetical protein